MPPRDSYYRDRYPRTRARGRGVQEDVITTSITVRIIVCAVLLLGIWVAGRLSPQGHQSFQAGYRALTAEEQTGFIGAAVRKGTDLLEYYWSMAEKLAHSIIYRLDGTEPPAEESLPPEEESIDEPLYGTVDDFDYNYLNAQEIALTGQGGEFPVDLDPDGDGTRLYAPSGSVLSPVFSTAKLKPPVTGPVTSPFAWRYHPITGTTDFHTGMDIAAAEGTPVLAALPGEVVEVGNSKVYGNYIVLRHADNFQTSYSHCSEIIARTGMKVKQGERIAKVGQTGTATGPHLHFSVLVDDLHTDPYWTLRDNLRTEEAG